jgi:hypothetical protein
MSLPDQAVPSHSTKNEHRERTRMSSGPSEPGQQQPRSVRLTVSLPGDLVDRLRDAVYWSPTEFLGRNGILASGALPKTKESASRGATSIDRSDYESVSSCQAHRHWY